MTEVPKRIWVDAKTAFGTGAHMAVRNAVTKAKGRAWTTDTEYTRSDIAAAREAKLIEALRLAIGIAEDWIHDELDWNDALDDALADLDPARVILAELEKP